MSSLGNTASNFLQRIGDIPNILLRLGTNYKTKSLIDVTQVARVEPLTVISKDCLNVEYITDVMQSALSLFTGYYLQAVALSSRVDNVRVVRVLDRLNPDRKFNDLLIISEESIKEQVSVSLESFKYRLPTSLNKPALESERARVLKPRVLATELMDKLDKVNIDTSDELLEMPHSGSHTDKDGIKQIMELSNLSVGKLINVDICFDETKVTVPISVRLNATSLNNEPILHILAFKKEDNTLVERFHAWRSGRIGLIKDLIFCQDLIDEHRRALMADESGVYSEIIRRVNSAKKFGILSGNPSLVSASNIFIISEEVAKDLERKMGGKLDSPHTREKVFNNTYAMLLIVINRDWERVTFYHRGISSSTEVSVKGMKTANNAKGGVDIADVLKSLSSGAAPSF